MKLLFETPVEEHFNFVTLSINILKESSSSGIRWCARG